MSNTTTFRLFISSTFNDFQREREILQTKVFPEIREYCRGRNFRFQPIDLRWGVSNLAQLDQKTLELCLGEVRTCKGHPHPNFLIMTGDRYGWVPLPYDIEKEEFESLLTVMTQDERETLLEWYREDLNQLPVSYIIRQRDGEYVDHDKWAETENILRKILQEAVNKSSLTEKQQRKYFLSATEAEVVEGIIPYLTTTSFQQTLLDKTPELAQIDPQRVFGFLRDIDKHSQQGSKFIGDDYTLAQEFKTRIQEALIPENILQVQTTQTSPEDLDEEYLKAFQQRITAFIKKQIDAQKQQTEQFSPLEIEQQAQALFASQKRQNFIGQAEALDRIAQYLDDDTTQPLILYGPSGQGKSAIIAKAIEQAGHNSSRQLCYRFVGATPQAGSSKQVLLSIFDELGINLHLEQHEADTEQNFIADQNKQESFEDFSYRVHDTFMKIDHPVTLFIDAVDQFVNSDEFLWLPRTLPPNVKIVLTALNDEKYRKDSHYLQTLQQKSNNLYEIPAFQEPEKLLLLLLGARQRTLQPHQLTWFLQQYQAVQTPLYITVAAQEIRHWQSFDGVPNHPPTAGGVLQNLADTQQAVIREFIDNLHRFHHHEIYFVHRVLGYIYASGDGLSENELLELLAENKTFLSRIAPDTFHKNLTGELPLVIWTRLYTTLTPFLSRKSQDGEELLYFFHREFADVIHALPGQQAEHEAIIKSVQNLISRYYQHDTFTANRWGKLYVSLIGEYDLRYTDDKKVQDYALFIAEQENKVWVASCLGRLNEIGEAHYRYNRTDQAITYYKIYWLTAKLLYAANPDQWAQDYTTAMNNLANSYKSIERLQETITLEETSLAILQELYAENPDRWAKDYTRAMNNLAYSYKRVERLREAITLQEKTLSIRQKLYEAHPDRWAYDYTIAMINLAYSYKLVERLQDAITLQEKSLAILQELYAENPDRMAQDYTGAMNNLALFYKSVGRMQDAITLQEKSLAILQELYAENTDRWAENYTANAMNNLANSYYKIGRVQDAITLQEKTLAILQDLYTANPDRWTQYYTRIMNNLANSYKSIERLQETIALEEKSLAILQELYAENPDRWAHDYTRAMVNLADSYKRVERLREAITLEEKSLAILQEFYAAHPDRWTHDYTIAMNNLAASYTKVKRLQDAITLFEKSLAILDELYAANPDRWAQYFTGAMNSLAILYYQNNRFDDALKLFKKLYEIITTRYGDEDPQSIKIAAFILLVKSRKYFFRIIMASVVIGIIVYFFLNYL